MANPTRAVLRTRARIRADQDLGTFPTDTQFNYLLDEAAMTVWYALVGAGWPVDFSTTNITANGAASYTVVAGTGLVQAVYASVGGILQLMRRVDPSDISALRSATSAATAGYYEVRINAAAGLIIEFFPRPTSGAYRVDYIPDHPGFASDSDKWYGPGGSDELIVLAAAAKALRKEGENEDAAQLDREYAVLLEQVATRANWVDMRNPPKIRDVHSSDLRLGFDYQVGSNPFDT